MTLDEYQTLLEDTYYAKHNESTAAGYKSCLKKVCKDIRVHFDFDNLKHSDVLKLILEWQKSLANKTINNRMVQLRDLCKLAHNDGLWPLNPCEDIKNLAPDEFIEIKPFTREEIPKMVNTSTSQPSAKRLTLFGIQVGMRMEELVVLCWGDVDWKNRTISVNRARALELCHAPKTKQSKRVIPLTDEALELLKAQFAVTGHGSEHTIKMKDKSAKKVANVKIQPIFIDDLTGDMFQNSKDFAERFFTQFLQDAGVEHRGPSQLRHTFASRALSNGMNIAPISKIMGHADTKTTEKHYAQYMPCRKEDDMAILNTALSFKPNAIETKPSLRQRIAIARRSIIRTVLSVFRSGEKKVVNHLPQSDPLQNVPCS